ncbi:hypothetical protein F5148DRAFT_1267596 [Russula earlei]|uniref:Uncharacterized protein n=1 Tax=Russula earlei TaxID=71964 RepID=A0ACC0TRW6_9AGAM|nr:hypothetical protein F5148DRAFT_1267596 [Russula earlei]
MRASEIAAIFCLAIGIVPSFALPSGDAPNPTLDSGKTVRTSPNKRRSRPRLMGSGSILMQEGRMGILWSPDPWMEEAWKRHQKQKGKE